MKKTLIVLVVIAVILLGVYVLQKNPSTTSPAAANIPVQAPSENIPAPSAATPASSGALPAPASIAPSQEASIIYTDSGYAPASLKIKVGSTVTFKNQSQKSMWPASAMHPTHTGYPTTGGCLGSTFDACTGIPSGGAWSFKFDIVGDWKYHDHLTPKFFGSITVEK